LSFFIETDPEALYGEYGSFVYILQEIMTMNRFGAALVLGLLAPITLADIGLSGDATALTGDGFGEDRQVITLSTSGTTTDTAASSFGLASATVTVSVASAGASSSVHVLNTLDSGPNAVTGASSDGTFSFTVPAGTQFSLAGLLELHSTNPSGGAFVRIEGPGGVWFSAGPDFSQPTHPIDFSVIPSSGTLAFAGTYQFSWFQSANVSIVSDPTTADGDFTLTLTLPGCSPADLNSDGVLNFFDVSAFLSAFAAMDPSADFNDDGLFNFFDVSAFLSVFADGCP